MWVLCTASELTNEFMMSRLEPSERKRQDYIKELIATEQAYIEDMRLVHEVHSIFYFQFVLLWFFSLLIFGDLAYQGFRETTATELGPYRRRGRKDFRQLERHHCLQR